MLVQYKWSRTSDQRKQQRNFKKTAGQGGGKDKRKIRCTTTKFRKNIMTPTRMRYWPRKGLSTQHIPKYDKNKKKSNENGVKRIRREY